MQNEELNLGNEIFSKSFLPEDYVLNPDKRETQEFQKSIEPEKALNPVKNYKAVMPDFENILIKTFLERPEFFARAKSILKPEAFSNVLCKELYSIINKFYDTYKRIPDIPELQLEVKNIISPEIRKFTAQKIHDLGKVELISRDFMEDYTVRYIKDQMFERALMVGADFVDKKIESAKLKAKELIEYSQKVELTKNLGDTFKDFEERLSYYQNPEKGLKYLNFKSFNDLLGEGILPGTLNIFLAPPGIGKSMMLAHSICDFLLQKKNVLLVSMEMSNYEFLKRIDANILGVPMQDFKDPFKRAELIQKYKAAREKVGELFVQNYVPNTFSAYSLEALIDMYNTNNIKIDIVMLDYLGLMKSDRVQPNVGLYSYIKSIGEEVRGVAKHLNIAIFSASQLNRSSLNQDVKDINNSTISDSMGTAMTADLLVMMIQTEDQKLKHEITFKITKNRYSGETRTFKAHANYQLMRYEDIQGIEIPVEGNSTNSIKPEDKPLDKDSVDMSDILSTLS